MTFAVLHSEGRTVLRLWCLHVQLVRIPSTSTTPGYSCVSFSWCSPGWHTTRTWVQLDGPRQAPRVLPRINALPLGSDEAGPVTVRSGR